MRTFSAKMPNMLKKYIQTIRELFLFSIPLIAGQLGQMLFGIGDIVVAGRYSNDVVAALGIANGLLAPFLMFGLGVCFAIGPLASNFRGEKREETHLFANAHYLILIVSVFIMISVTILYQFLEVFEFTSSLTALVRDYLFICSISLVPALLFQVSKEYLQAWDKTFFANGLILVFNLVNIVMNYILIFGKFGAPELGIKGAAYATLITRTLLFIVLFLYTKKKFKIEWDWHPELFKRAAKLGLPIGFGTLSEVLLFSIVTVLVGKMTIVASASHNIALNLASLTFMIPLAISSAASVKVGMAFGAKSKESILRYSACSVLMSAIIMCFTCLMYLQFPQFLVRFATDDIELIKYSASLLLFVGLFQIPDGIQVTLWGVLRGLEETKYPMILSLILNWCIGLPFGYWLATEKNMEAAGLWAGLATGLTIMSVGLSFVFVLKYQSVKRKIA
ncbi:MATE family efflux transporter [Halobacteriovorax sp. HLS]|uniref:MATE family efflux transporter n=1 Tax=Halobacteriovorax sp. HLS TaxID=2234000 RepID=UPI000FD6F946|nr:MATE family efflux transporter [Halobacteriovorax sp. HLS]